MLHVGTSAEPDAALLDRWGVAAAPGPAWCRSWTDRVDAALRRATDRYRTGRSGGLAVVALAGYARRQLCPGSDIDVLVLHDGWSRPDLGGVVEALCYPLWDAGLSVGQVVATPRQALAAASDDLASATALCERRLVTGDPGLVEELTARQQPWLRRRGHRLVGELDAQLRARDATDAGRVGLLEPDLKAGAGGLRDLHVLRWGAAALLGAPDLDGLVGARYLGADDRRRLAAAADEVLTARCALHLVLAGPTGRLRGAYDRLRLDLQDEVAGRVGAADADALARDLTAAMRTVAAVRDRTWSLIAEDARRGRRSRSRVRQHRDLDDDLALVDGVVEATAAVDLAASPSLPLRAAAASAVCSTRLGRDTLQALRRAIAGHGPLRWDAPARGALDLLLRVGANGRAALTDLDDVGGLAAYLPDWPLVRGHPQRNPLHRFDVDTHGFEAVVALADVAAEHPQVWRRLPDRDGLRLAVWLHDIGKVWPGDHCEVGAERIGAWLDHMGVDPTRRDLVVRLVRHHLLLPDAATSLDLDDPTAIERMGRLVGDTATLDALYLLSLADGRATGPMASSPWRDELLATLHARVRARLLGDEPTVDPLPAGDWSALAELPEDYLRAVPVELVAVHAGLARACTASGHAEVRVLPGPVAATRSVTVVAPDRHHLLADVIGALTAVDADILDARAFTSTDGLAVDWFVVSGGVEEAVLVTRVSDAADGTGEVRRDLERWRRRSGATAPQRLPLGSVSVSSDDTPRVEVVGPDGPERLHRLAAALADAGVDVVGLRSVVLGTEVRHTWFCRPLPSGRSWDDVLAVLPADLGPSG